jgi:hypothetical protein
MRRVLLPAALLSLLLGCGGPKALELPVEPVDRAATCGVVAAASARSRTEVSAPLALEAQARILHHAVLAASEGGEFRSDVAKAVNDRMAALQDGITKGKWQDLAAPCAEAYPAAANSEVDLPKARLDAQLQCEELADFVVTALEGEEAKYGNSLADYRKMRREVNDALAAGLNARAGQDLAAQQKARRRALAAASGLGSPVPVLTACLKRFP